VRDRHNLATLWHIAHVRTLRAGRVRPLLRPGPRGLVMPELLLVARRDEHFARFWRYAEKDEADAPRAMKELIAGRGPVKGH